MLAHFYIAVYILDITPCESFLLAKNGSSKLKTGGADNIFIAWNIYIYTYTFIYIHIHIYIHILYMYIHWLIRNFFLHCSWKFGTFVYKFGNFVNKFICTFFLSSWSFSPWSCSSCQTYHPTTNSQIIIHFNILSLFFEVRNHIRNFFN